MTNTPQSSMNAMQGEDFVHLLCSWTMWTSQYVHHNNCEPALLEAVATHPTALFWLPTFMTCSISLTLLATKEERSLTYTPVSGLSLKSSLFLCSLLSKSRISSWQISKQEARTRYCSSWDREMCVKMWLKEFGITPHSSGLLRMPTVFVQCRKTAQEQRFQCIKQQSKHNAKDKVLPSIVYVFPVPVCPYANIVPVKEVNFLSTPI